MISVKMDLNAQYLDSGHDQPPIIFVARPTGWRIASKPRVWSPPTDVCEIEDAYLIRVEIAGMKEADFALSLNQNALIISGTREDQLVQKAFHQMEIHYGEFEIQVEIPTSVEPHKASAEYKNGFLFIQLPKTTPREINITDGMQ
jgi:HSP20 family protein